MSRSTRTLLVFTLSLVVAGVFSMLVYQAAQRPAATAAPATVQVAVAARALPVGAKLTADDVKLVAWPAASPMAGAIGSVEAAVNRGLLSAVVENEPLTDAKVAAVGAGAGLPPRIAAGMRAISVKVDDVVGVAGFAVPGAHVDVVVSVTQREQSVARVVVSNVEVLATGTRTGQARTDIAASADSVVTLLVTPGDAERISLAASVGRITLTLRNPLDQTATDTRGTQVAALLGAPEPTAAAPVAAASRPAARVVRQAEPAPAPPPPPPAPYTVETIRAAKRTAEEVKK